MNNFKDLCKIKDINKYKIRKIIKYKKCLNCNKKASYNHYMNIIPIYCVKHKKNNMIDIKNKKCIKCNIRQPICNYKNETKALYCGNCKLDNMINIITKKCIKCNNKIPIFNYKNEIKALYCLNCKTKDMIDIKNKKCIKCNNIRPSYNYENKKKALYCDNCKIDNMINIISKRCIKCNIKQPTFNYKNKKKALYCIDCKLDDMIDVNNKKCIKCNIKQPRFNYENKKKILYCGDCKLDNMIDIIAKKCIICNIKQARVKKYKGYCIRCFMFNFPNEFVTRNYKIKENHVTDYIKEEFRDINLIFDKTILCGCSKRRPDIFIDLFNYCIIIEVDENQHKSKEYEDNNRNYEIYEDLANRPLIFIRFNPDSYKNNNKKVKSCFKICKSTGIQIVDSKKKFNKRLNKLKETINYYLENKPKEDITIHKLYYDIQNQNQNQNH
jgi:uncharacterized protein YajQ (UPF0234 family)